MDELGENGIGRKLNLPKTEFNKRVTWRKRNEDYHVFALPQISYHKSANNFHLVHVAFDFHIVRHFHEHRSPLIYEEFRLILCSRKL